jgi:SAM-dependent methyltransferase
MSSPSDVHVPVINYDKGGYDYRQFWRGRDYEHWAEARVLQRLLKRAGQIEWLADFGGGFGRNVPHYRQFARHVVLIDYSWTNLTNAEQTLLPDGPNDQVFLIRGNLYHLPFRDGAFDVGSTVRVIHHLSAIDAALDEMSRAISHNWILDVPIKHHLLARLRASLSGKGRSLRSPEPNPIGSPDEPFYNFSLRAILQTLRHEGWQPELAASVANFRRWERVVPGPLRGLARPVVYGGELASQRIGRGWWGPSQFLWLTRPTQTAPSRAATVAGDVPHPWDTLAHSLCCPQCHGDLRWSSETVTCAACGKTFQRKGAIWDFVVE